MLMTMYGAIKFDRDIDPKIHIFSPGGYEMRFGSKVIAFDFASFIGNRDKNDASIINFEQYDLDTDCYPDADDISADDVKNLNEIIEFYVYTGEYGDPDLKPVKLISLSFEFEDGIKIDCTETDAVRNFRMC